MTSSRNDIDLTHEELQNASPKLRDRLISRFARLKALQFLRREQLFDHNAKYLRQKAKAVRRSQGLKMGDDPDDEIVLGDKTTIFGMGAAVVIAAAILSVGFLVGRDKEQPTVESVDTDTRSTLRPDTEP